MFNNTSYPVFDLGNAVCPNFVSPATCGTAATNVTIPSNTVDHFFLLHTTDGSNNVDIYDGPYNVTLPPATAAGQVITVLSTNPTTFAFTHYFPAAGDQIRAFSFVAASNAAANTNGDDTQSTFYESGANWAQFISDGNHTWYLMENQ